MSASSSAVDTEKSRKRAMLHMASRLLSPKTWRYMMTQARARRFKLHSREVIAAVFCAKLDELARLGLLNTHNEGGVVIKDRHAARACEDMGYKTHPRLVGGVGVQSDLSRVAKLKAKKAAPKKKKAEPEAEAEAEDDQEDASSDEE